MKYILHKISEGFIITSDVTPDKGYDGFYYLEGKLYNTSKTMLQTSCKEVIAQQDQIDFSSLSEVEQKRIGWFDNLELSKQFSEQGVWQCPVSYEIGFNKAIELLSDRMFTGKNIVEAIAFGFSICKQFDRAPFDSEQIKFIQSLSQKSWTVELEMQDYFESGHGGEFPAQRIRLTNSKIKILKLL
jgi:hypothetical protein